MARKRKAPKSFSKWKMPKGVKKGSMRYQLELRKRCLKVVKGRFRKIKGCKVRL